MSIRSCSIQGSITNLAIMGTSVRERSSDVDLNVGWSIVHIWDKLNSIFSTMLEKIKLKSTVGFSWFRYALFLVSVLHVSSSLHCVSREDLVYMSTRSFSWFLDTVYPELFRPDRALLSGKLVIRPNTKQWVNQTTCTDGN